MDRIGDLKILWTFAKTEFDFSNNGSDVVEQQRNAALIYLVIPFFCNNQCYKCEQQTAELFYSNHALYDRTFPVPPHAVQVDGGFVVVPPPGVMIIPV